MILNYESVFQSFIERLRRFLPKQLAQNIIFFLEVQRNHSFNKRKALDMVLSPRQQAMAALTA